MAFYWSISDVLLICAQEDLRCLGERMREGLVHERRTPHFYLGHALESVELQWMFGSSICKHILRVYGDCQFQCSPCAATLNMSHYSIISLVFRYSSQLAREDTHHRITGTVPSRSDELHTQRVLILLPRLSLSVLGVARSGSVIVVGEALKVAYCV